MQIINPSINRLVKQDNINAVRGGPRGENLEIVNFDQFCTCSKLPQELIGKVSAP